MKKFNDEFKIGDLVGHPTHGKLLGIVIEEKRYTGAKWIVYWFDLKHTIPHYPEHIFRI